MSFRFRHVFLPIYPPIGARRINNMIAKERIAQGRRPWTHRYPRVVHHRFSISAITAISQKPLFSLHPFGPCTGRCTRGVEVLEFIQVDHYGVTVVSNDACESCVGRVTEKSLLFVKTQARRRFEGTIVNNSTFITSSLSSVVYDGRRVWGRGDTVKVKYPSVARTSSLSAICTQQLCDQFVASLFGERNRDYIGLV